MEIELKDRISEYSAVVGQLASVEQSQTGSLLTRDFSASVDKSTLIDTGFLTTVFVVVQRIDVKTWDKTYESLTEYVVPRSSKLIVQENDYSLYSVVTFKKFLPDFQNECRQKRFTVRKLESSQKLSEKELAELREKQSKLKKRMLRWTLTNFGEAFLSWIHLKCIQCFVESILRFGLPPDFQAVLIQPRQGKAKNLEKTLTELYKHLEPTSNGDVDPEEEMKHGALLGGDKFFPFVFLEVELPSQ